MCVARVDPGFGMDGFLGVVFVFVFVLFCVRLRFFHSCFMNFVILGAAVHVIINVIIHIVIGIFMRGVDVSGSSS